MWACVWGGGCREGGPAGCCVRAARHRVRAACIWGPWAHLGAACIWGPRAHLGAACIWGPRAHAQRCHVTASSPPPSAAFQAAPMSHKNDRTEAGCGGGGQIQPPLTLQLLPRASRQALGPYFHTPSPILQNNSKACPRPALKCRHLSPSSCSSSAERRALAPRSTPSAAFFSDSRSISSCSTLRSTCGGRTGGKEERRTAEGGGVSPAAAAAPCIARGARTYDGPCWSHHSLPPALSAPPRVCMWAWKDTTPQPLPCLPAHLIQS